MEPGSPKPWERDLQDMIEMVVSESTRLDALIARVGALEIEMPIGQVEVHEEIHALEAKLESLTARLAKLEAADVPPARPRGVIGTMRVERPAAADDGTGD